VKFTHTTSQSLLIGVLSHKPLNDEFSQVRRHPLKLILQNSRNRKAPITLPSAPFDHRDDHA
jgi:hypothetical protein